MDRLRRDLTKRGITASSAVFTSQLFTAGAMSAPAGLASSLSNMALLEVGQVTFWSTMVMWFSKPLFLLGSAGLVVSSSFGVAQWGSRPGTQEVSIESVSKSVSSSLFDQSTMLSLHLAVDDLEGIYSLDNPAREKALIRLTNHLNGMDGAVYLQPLFRRWTRLEAKRCAGAILSLLVQSQAATSDALLAEELSYPLAAWQAEDQIGLLHWLKEIPRADRSERFAMRSALGVIAKHDIGVAFDYLAGRGGTGDDAYIILAEALNKRSMESACTALSNLPNPNVMEASLPRSQSTTFVDSKHSPRARLINASIPFLYDRDRQAVADWIVGLPAQSDSDLFTGTFVGLWASKDPVRAAAWVLELHASTQRATLPVLTERWARVDPRQALDWLFEANHAGNSWEMAEPGFQTWLGLGQIDEPQSWLEQHTHTVEAAALFGRFSDALTPKEALAWADQLPSGNLHDKAKSHALFRLALLDSHTAKLHVNDLQMIDAVAKGLFVGSGLNALTAWQEELVLANKLEFAHATILSEVSLLAAYDPYMISTKVLEMPEGNERDQALEILLERTHLRSADSLSQARLWSGEFTEARLTHSWRERFDQVDRDHPWTNPRTLPSSTTFREQTLSTFNQGLELMATISKVRSTAPINR